MRLLCISLLFVFSSASLAVRAQEAEARVLLEDAMKQVTKTQSWGIALNISPDGTVVENPADYKMEVEIALEGKVNACVKMKMGEQEVQFYENGKERSYFYAHKGWLKQAVSGPRESMIAGMVGEPLAHVTTWLAGYLHGNKKILSEAKEVNYVGEQIVNDMNTDQLFLEYPDYNVDIFFKKGVGVPVNITFTLRDFSTAAPEELGGRKGGKVFCTFKSWQPNFRVAPEAFVYQKPVVEEEEVEEEPQKGKKSMESSQLPSLSIPFLDGGTFDLSSYKGKKALVLDFWASWCAPCKESLPVLDDLNASMRLRNVEIIAISVDENAAAAKDFVNKNNLDLQVAHDENGEAAAAFRASSIPTTVAISKEGELVAYETGYSRDYEDKMRAILTALEKE